MKELEFQGLVRKGVVAAGGWALKMSNRFLVGVPDLLIQLPDYPGMLIEAKADKVSSRSRFYTLDITPKQAHTLRSAAAAGMLSGVISMLSTGQGKYGVRVQHIDRFEGETSIRLQTLTYTWCQRQQLGSVCVAALQRLGNESSLGVNLPCSVTSPLLLSASQSRLPARPTRRT